MAATEPKPKASQVEEAFESLGHLSSNEQRTRAISVLATASREEPDVRRRLAEPQCLRTLVETVEGRLHDDGDDQRATAALALRCIGNACTHNAGRKHVAEELGFDWAPNGLTDKDDSIRLLTAKVLYNICSDEEGVQLACYRKRLHYGLLALCTTRVHSLEPADAALVTDLIFEIVSQKANDEAQSGRTEELPRDVLQQLLHLPVCDSDVQDNETFATALECVLPYLRDPEIQTTIVQSRLVEQLWKNLEAIESRLNLLHTLASPHVAGAAENEDEDKELLVGLATSITWCLSDIAANPQFAEQYTLENPWVGGVIRLIVGAGSGRDDRDDESLWKVNAACQVLGNILWHLPPDRFEALAETTGKADSDGELPAEPLHTSLFSAMSRQDDAEFLHSAASLLVQLTRPSPRARQLIGADSYATAVLSKLCTHATPHLQQDGLRLLRALGKDCPANQERFAELAKQAMEHASTAASAAVGTSAEADGTTEPPVHESG